MRARKGSRILPGGVSVGAGPAGAAGWEGLGGALLAKRAPPLAGRGRWAGLGDQGHLEFSGLS